jgi:lipopolysaccharide transport system permease protein
VRRDATTEGGDVVVQIRKREGWPGFGFRDLWRDRELLWFLTQRDLKVRYKQTFFGVAWAVGQPLIMMFVFTIIFGRIAHLPSEGLPYSVFVLGGLVPWGLVSNGIPAASVSLLSNVPLITKVRIHNMLVPASTVLGSVVDLFVAIGLVVVYAATQGVWPGLAVFTLPLFIALDVAVVFGLALLLSSVCVLYRDIRYAVPFGVQVFLFLTPVVYPTGAVSGSLRWLYALNPMVGVVEGFRWSLLGSGSHLAGALPASLIGALVLLLGGALVFRRIEPSFPDVV